MSDSNRFAPNTAGSGDIDADYGCHVPPYCPHFSPQYGEDGRTVYGWSGVHGTNWIVPGTIPHT